MRRFNGYMHGIDIGGWLSQCDYSKEHLDNFITEEDIKRIKGWGCDHVRVPYCCFVQQLLSKPTIFI